MTIDILKNLAVIDSIVADSDLSITVNLKQETPLLSPYDDTRKVLRMSSIRPHLDPYLYIYLKRECEGFEALKYEDITDLKIQINGRERLLNFRTNPEPIQFLKGPYIYFYCIPNSVPPLSISVTNLPCTPLENRASINASIKEGLAHFFYWYNAGLFKGKGFGQFTIETKDTTSLSRNNLLQQVKKSTQIGFLIKFLIQKYDETGVLSKKTIVNEICNQYNKNHSYKSHKNQTYHLSTYAKPINRNFLKFSNLKFESDNGKIGRDDKGGFIEKFLFSLPKLKQDLTEYRGEAAEPSLIRLFVQEQYTDAPDDIKPYLLNGGKVIRTDKNKEFKVLGSEASFRNTTEQGRKGAYSNLNEDNRVLFYRALLGFPEYLDFMVDAGHKQFPTRLQSKMLHFTFKDEKKSLITELKSGIQYKMISNIHFVIAYPHEEYFRHLSDEELMVPLKASVKGEGSVVSPKYKPVRLPRPAEFSTVKFAQWLEHNMNNWIART